MTRKASRKTPQTDPNDIVLTSSMLARAKRREDLPAEIEALLPRRRGPGRKPAKVSLTLRVSPQTVAAFKATGSGWQTRINEALDRAAKRLEAS